MPQTEYTGDLMDMIETEMMEEAESLAKPLPFRSEEIPEGEIVRKKSERAKNS
jgi:hypothetical protein